jgi:hypothetical protein
VATLRPPPRRRRLLAVLAVVAVVAAGVGAYLVLSSDDDETAGPAPRVVIREEEPEAAEDLGFPAFATKNTTRVAGADAIADAAGVALAVFPSTGGVDGPAAATLVDADDPASALAAAVLSGPPISAPVLVSEREGVPDLTSDALRALGPSGSAATDDAQIFRIGAASSPGGVRTEEVEGDNPAEIAAEIDRLRQRLTGRGPQHILLVSSDRLEFAMPAAAWAARSGDPLLFLQRESAPKPTLDAIRRHPGVPVYVLGPSSAISDRALDPVRKVAPSVTRVTGDDPISNAVAFARYVDGSFGWNINDPGHGFVVANTASPLDAAAAAPLSASGTWGPLLVTDDPGGVPPALRGYLLDVKPGYVSDPTRAVYNHVWLIGDVEVMSVAFQAQVDELVDLAPVRSGAEEPELGPPPGTPERERR